MLSGSMFWNGIEAVRPAFSVGAHFSINNGMSTWFWLVSWLGRTPLWQTHTSIFQLATDTHIFVGEALRSYHPVVHFMRTLYPAEEASWADLVAMLSGRQLSLGADAVT